MKLSIALPAGVAVLAIIVAAVVQGFITERFSEHDSEQLQRYIAQLKTLPMNIGDWEGTDRDLNESELEQLKAAHAKGNISRSYKHIHTGEVVSISLICGHSQFVSQHTPPQCYVSAGFTMARDSVVYPPTNDRSVEFRTAVFTKDEKEGTKSLEIYWSWWTDDVQWVAPTVQKSKWQFAGQPALYKLYVINSNPRRHQNRDESPAVHFIRDVLPTLNEVFSSQAPESKE